MKKQYFSATVLSMALFMLISAKAFAHCVRAKLHPLGMSLSPSTTNIRGVKFRLSLSVHKRLNVSSVTL